MHKETLKCLVHGIGCYSILLKDSSITTPKIGVNTFVKYVKQGQYMDGK